MNERPAQGQNRIISPNTKWVAKLLRSAHPHRKTKYGKYETFGSRRPFSCRRSCSLTYDDFISASLRRAKNGSFMCACGDEQQHFQAFGCAI